MDDKIYGIQYDRFCCGGKVNAKIIKVGESFEVFSKESNMLIRLGELKADDTIMVTDVFTSVLNREKYVLQ